METKFIKVTKLNELLPGTSKNIKIFGKAIAVFNIEGNFYATEGMCKHMKAPLGGLDSFVREKTVTCNRHGWRYDIPSGNCLTHDWAKLKIYEVKIESDYLMVAYTEKNQEEEILNSDFPDLNPCL